jgi:hypothetical protein
MENTVTKESAPAPNKFMLWVDPDGFFTKPIQCMVVRFVKKDEEGHDVFEVKNAMVRHAPYFQARAIDLKPNPGFKPPYLGN